LSSSLRLNNTATVKNYVMFHVKIKRVKRPLS
jgi:hypothetical protein